MTRPQDHIRDRWAQYELPLPGLHPVLTWQLNVTLHQATGLAKFVSTVREPNDHQEVRRAFNELGECAPVLRAVLIECEAAVAAMCYLLSLPGPEGRPTAD